MGTALVPDFAIPTPENAEDRRYVFTASEPKNFDDAKQTLEVVISTRAIDREWDVVESSGLDFTDFMKDPVVLWCHDRKSMPVGRVLAISATVDTVTAIVQFDSDEQGKRLYRKYRDKWMSSWSISFLPKPGGVDMMEIPVGVDQNGNPMVRTGYHVTKSLVIELSCVPVAANIDARTKEFEEWVNEMGEDDPLRRDLSEFMEKRCIKGMIYDDLKAPVEKDAGDGDKGAKQMTLKPTGEIIFLKNHDPEKAKQVKLRKSAFSKSIAEAVTAGKVLTEIVQVKTIEEVGSEVVFEPIQMNDEMEIVEARVLGIRVKVFGELTPEAPKGDEPGASETPTQPDDEEGREEDEDNAGSDEGEPKEGDDTDKSLDLHSIEKELAEAEMEMEMLNCELMVK